MTHRSFFCARIHIDISAFVCSPLEFPPHKYHRILCYWVCPLHFWSSTWWPCPLWNACSISRGRGDSWIYSPTFYPSEHSEALEELFACSFFWYALRSRTALPDAEIRCWHWWTMRGWVAGSLSLFVWVPLFDVSSRKELFFYNFGVLVSIW